jgi:hypothetical protein
LWGDWHWQQYTQGILQYKKITRLYAIFLSLQPVLIYTFGGVVVVVDVIDTDVEVSAILFCSIVSVELANIVSKVA